jgi:hypothetical protein
MKRKINAYVHMQEKEQPAAGEDQVGLRIDMGFLLCHMHSLTLPPQREEGKGKACTCTGKMLAHPVQLPGHSGNACHS